MQGAREQQSATLLPGGDVLVAGGLNEGGFCCSQFKYSTAELYDPAACAWFPTASMAAKHAGQAATLLPNGWVLVAGGGDFRVHTGCAGAPVPPGGTCTVAVRFAPSSTSLRTATVSVSDNAPRSPQGVPVTGYGGGPDAWTPTGPMTSAREHFAATLLPGGKVLMAGGPTVTGGSLASAELYNPATRSFSATGSLHAARSDPAAAQLPDGKVLVTGGLSGNFIALASAELYDPATGTWASTTPMNTAGYGLTA